MSTHTHSLVSAGKLGGAGLTSSLPSESKLLLNGKELAAKLGVSLRLIEKWSANGVIPKLVVSSRFTRYQLPKVLTALEQYEAATLK